MKSYATSDQLERFLEALNIFSIWVSYGAWLSETFIWKGILCCHCMQYMCFLAKLSWVCLHLIELHVEVPDASMILLVRELKPVYEQKASSPPVMIIFNTSIKDDRKFF